MDEIVADKWEIIWWSYHISFLWLSLKIELNEMQLYMDSTSRRISEHCLVAVGEAVKERREFCPFINKVACGDQVYSFILCGNPKPEAEG